MLATRCKGLHLATHLTYTVYVQRSVTVSITHPCDRRRCVWRLVELILLLSVVAFQHDTWFRLVYYMRVHASIISHYLIGKPTLCRAHSRRAHLGHIARVCIAWSTMPPTKCALSVEKVFFRWLVINFAMVPSLRWGVTNICIKLPPNLKKRDGRK